MAKTYKLRDVEAEQLTFNVEHKDENKRTNAGTLAEWCKGRESWVPGKRGLVPQVVFESRTGTRVVNVGDWLVKRNETDFDVLTDRDFQGTYDTGAKK